MSIELTQVRRIRAVSEAAFAVDETGGGFGGWTDIPAREGATLARAIESLDPQTLVQSRVDHRLHVLGRRTASLQMEIPFAPTGVAANASTATVSGAVGLILRVVLGAERVGQQGSTVASAASASELTVAAGHGTRFAAGTAIGVISSGRMHMREINSISGDTLTLRKSLPATPSVGAAVYNSATYSPIEDPSESLQVLVQGAESDDVCLLLGCQVTALDFAIDPAAGAIPLLRVTLTATRWLSASEIAGSAGTLAAATYSNFAPIAAHVGDFREGASVAGDTATSSVLASAIAITPQIEQVHVPALDGVEGRKRWRASRSGPFVTGSLTLPFEDEAWDGYVRNRTLRYLSCQLGTEAGGSILIVAPTVQVTAATPADASGISSLQVTWHALKDSGSAGTTAREDAPLRIHFG